MRTMFVAGNWKMNLNHADGTHLATHLAHHRASAAASHVEIAVIPPVIYLQAIHKVINGTHLKLGAQNCWYEKHGAFTGEISVQMLRECGVQYVLAGHSERRHICNEHDGLINKKVQAIIAEDLTAVLCVGETGDQRKAYKTVEVVGEQLAKGLAHVNKRAVEQDQLVIAYEPVWAIGTGVNAKPEEAQEVHVFIRQQLAKLFGNDDAANVRIVYGGSVKANNAYEILRQPDVDGALVGGASLIADEFLGIVDAAARARPLAL